MKVKLTYDGPAKLRCCEAAQDLVAELAMAALDRLGDGYGFYVGVAGGEPEGGNHPRAFARIWAITEEAKKENAANNSMLKALK